MEKTRPSTYTSTYSGVKMPHTGHKQAIKNSMQRRDSAVAAGIMLGQYTSHGTWIFLTTGSHRVRYKQMPRFAHKLATPRCSIALDTGGGWRRVKSSQVRSDGQVKVKAGQVRVRRTC